MAERVGVSTEALEEFLYALGCLKRDCPTEYVCIWKLPDGSDYFTAPNPSRVYIVPGPELKKFVDLFREIMTPGS